MDGSDRSVEPDGGAGKLPLNGISVGDPMSGGSYDYAYSKLDELDRWVDTLEAMAVRCREWAASDRAATKYVDGAHSPSTLEDRARIHVRGMLLEKAAGRLKRAVDEVKSLERIMHDVEWVASGDYGIDDLMGPLGGVE
jgi:hypothetical protein